MSPRFPRSAIGSWLGGMDVGIAVAAWAAITMLAWGLFATQTDEAVPGPGPRWSVGQFVALAAPLPIWLGLMVWHELGGLGRGRQTYGKRLLGIQVVNADDGAPASLGQMWARTGFLVLGGAIVGAAWLAASLFLSPGLSPTVALGATVIVAVPLAGRDGRGLHDRTCGTRLVRPR